MMDKTKLFLITILIVLSANVLFLNYVIFSEQKKTSELEIKFNSANERFNNLNQKLDEANLLKNVQGESVQVDPKINLESNSCPNDCKNLITSAVGSIKIPVAKTPLTKGEYYIPLGTGQVDSLNAWTDINTAQASFDLNNFPRVKAVFFETILRVPNSSGEVKARLVDTSTPYIYAGNETRSTSSIGQLVSAPINLQRGQKNYKVQMFTTISTGVLDSARIKIVTE